MKSSKSVRLDNRRSSIDPIAVANRPRAREVGLCFGNHLQIPLVQGRNPPHVSRMAPCIVILATDAPLSSRQLHRMTRRRTFGLGRVGAEGGRGSGDYFIAFSTTYRQRIVAGLTTDLAIFVEDESRLNPFFRATADVVEEAILNSFSKAETMRGRDDRTVHAQGRGLTA